MKTIIECLMVDPLHVKLVHKRHKQTVSITSQEGFIDEMKH